MLDRGERVATEGTVDHDVDGTELLDGRAGDPLAVFGLRDAGGNGQRATTGAGDLGGDVRESVGAAGDEHDGRALAGERQGGGPAQSGADPGDDRDAVLDESGAAHTSSPTSRRSCERDRPPRFDAAAISAAP